MLHLTWIVPLVLLIVFFTSPRFRGDIAESRVRRILAQGLDKRHYTILNNVTVPLGGGTIDIDHLVVSKFGIFVIDSVQAAGWISGTEVQDRWKQSSLGRSHRFDNPVHRNQLQAQALGELLDMPPRFFHRMVVISGHKGFKGDSPAAVVAPEKLVRRMRSKGEHLLDSEQTARVLTGIEAVRLEPRGGIFINRFTILKGFLVLILLAGLYLAFGDQLKEYAAQWSMQSEQRENPALFHPDGSRKTEQELWEDALRCAWSADTGRCVCYEQNGARADLAFERCRELAERGSILKQ